MRKGVATQLQADEPRAIYIHCYGHSLNLAASDTITRCHVIKSALETTHEISKLIKYSPQREQLFLAPLWYGSYALQGGLFVLIP